MVPLFWLHPVEVKHCHIVIYRNRFLLCLHRRVLDREVHFCQKYVGETGKIRC